MHRRQFLQALSAAPLVSRIKVTTLELFAVKVNAWGNWILVRLNTSAWLRGRGTYERAIKAGFDAVKLAPFDDMPRDLSNGERIERFTKLGIERASALRKAIGPQSDLLIDVHGHLDLARGLELARALVSRSTGARPPRTPPELRDPRRHST
ncbi:MAG: enolase C-terminal domain-like protein [Bryobacteraceae bacterium]